MLNNIDKKQLQEYFREISNRVICPKKLKQEFINQLRNDIDCFISDNPGAKITDIKENFGTAEAIAESFTQGLDSSELKKKLSIRKMILVAVVIALVIYAAFVVISLIDVHNEAHGYIREGIMMMKNNIIGGETV